MIFMKHFIKLLSAVEPPLHHCAVIVAPLGVIFSHRMFADKLRSVAAWASWYDMTIVIAREQNDNTE